MPLKTLAAALLGLFIATEAVAQDYGPITDPNDYNKYWTKLDKDNKSAWRFKVVEILTERGFSEVQIKKFSRLVFVRDIDGDGVPDKVIDNNILKFNSYDLPLQWNSETGQPMPLDPEGYARAIPDCYKTDERTCTLKFSTNVSREALTKEDETIPQNERPSCLLPERTRAFCQHVGFVNQFSKKKFDTLVTVPTYRATCGEAPRTFGCGASEVLFDDGEAQTKLAFSMDEAITAADTTAASPVPPKTFPKIVYHLNESAFDRREGPAAFEEWEIDAARFVKLGREYNELYGKKEFEKRLAEISAEMLKIEKSAPIAYCQPHDVLQGCDHP